MEDVKKRFGLDTKIEGKNPLDYISALIEKNDKNEMELDRVKASNGLLRQYNNLVRSHIDATRVALKELEMKSQMVQLHES